ncbi:MAG TPA: 2-amino-4-hydroxy-6-hydroxymethyldihydropteridine diphosphokinase [Acidobacteriota bacterium]
MRYFLGLGSNLGRKRENLARARRLLEQNGIRLLRRSAEYRTQPVGDPDQPWFINQVVEAETGLDSLELLALVKRLEGEMKRKPGPRGGPRRIDIDILLAGRCIISTPLLQVPHPRLTKRNFVLRPLAEIAPWAIHPIRRKTVRRLLRETNDRSSVQKLRSR